MITHKVGLYGWDLRAIMAGEKSHLLCQDTGRPFQVGDGLYFLEANQSHYGEADPMAMVSFVETGVGRGLVEGYVLVAFKLID